MHFARRPEMASELRQVVRLATPVVAVQLGLMFMGTLDTLMLGRVSPTTLAAGALGNNFAMALLLAAWGIVQGIDPLVSQAHGAGDVPAIRAHLQRGLIVATALSLPLAAAFWDARGALAWLSHQPAVAAEAAGYVRGLIPGNVAFLLFIVLRQTLQAMSLIRPALIAIIAGNVVNLAANWILIFGHLGAPKLGALGSAYATSLGRWTLLLVLLWAGRSALAPYWRGFDRAALSVREYARYFALGLPIGLHYSLEIGVFSVVGFLMGRLGVPELGGHQIALNLASVSFMVPAGIGAAATTRVGNAIGRGDPAAVKRAAATCLVLGVGAMAGFGLLFAAAPHFLARLYTPDAGVIAMAAALIPIAAVFQIFDGAQVVSVGILRGAADTRTPAMVAILGFWLLGLPLGVGLAFRGEMGPRGLWWGLTAGLVVVAGLLLARTAWRLRRPLGPLGRLEAAIPQL
jgi:MATE family multidrug resistance protein